MSADNCINCHKTGTKSAYLRSSAFIRFKDGDAPIAPELAKRHYVCIECAEAFHKFGGNISDFCRPLHREMFRVVEVIKQPHTDEVPEVNNRGDSRNLRHDKKVDEQDQEQESVVKHQHHHKKHGHQHHHQKHIHAH